MLPKYELAKMEETLYAFYRATGVTATFFDAELRPITRRATQPARYCTLVNSTKPGMDACRQSNARLLEACRRTRTTVRHICGAGLVDMAVPLVHGELILGYLVLGQLKKEETLPPIADSLPIDRTELEKCYRELPCLDEERIASIMQIAVMLTKYLMLEDMVTARGNRSAEAVSEYIEAHLTEKLTVDCIASAVHMSASGIYKSIRTAYGCTVGEYITARRIKRSLPMLFTEGMSIEEIAAASGFTDAAYFSRCFKRIHGMSPLKYRKQHLSG